MLQKSRYRQIIDFIVTLKTMVIYISNIIDNIGNVEEDDNYMRVIEEDEEIQALLVELYTTPISDEEEKEEDFGLECTCGYIEINVWDNRQCSSCGNEIDIGNITFQSDDVFEN